MDLSDDEWVNIFTFLTVVDICRVSFVNKRLNEFCNDEKGVLWSIFSRKGTKKLPLRCISGWRRFLQIFGNSKLEYKPEPIFDVNPNGIISNFKGKVSFPVTSKMEVRCFEIQ